MLSTLSLPAAAPSSQELPREPTLLLEDTWHLYFADIPRVNEVRIAYDSSWKRRLAVIRLRDEVTFITLNALLQDQRIPTDVCRIQLAHELVHYAHGFGSPLPRQFADPHANGSSKLSWNGEGSATSCAPATTG